MRCLRAIMIAVLANGAFAAEPPPVTPWKVVGLAQPTTGTLVFPNQTLSVTVSLEGVMEPLGAYAVELRGNIDALQYSGADNLQPGMLLTTSLRVEGDDLVLRVAAAGTSDPRRPALFRARYLVPRFSGADAVTMRLTENPAVTGGVLLRDDPSGTRVRVMFDSLAVARLPIAPGATPFPAPTPLPPIIPVQGAEGTARQVIRAEPASYDANHNLDTVIDCADVIARRRD